MIENRGNYIAYNEIIFERRRIMFGEKFKKDKQNAIEKEIEDVLYTMRQICPKDHEDYITNLDVEIESVLEVMDKYQPDSDEYTQMVKNLDVLYGAKQKEKNRMTMYIELSESLERLYKLKGEKKQSQFPWREVVVGVCGLAQILVIIKHEEVNVITGKALAFVSKGRV